MRKGPDRVRLTGHLPGLDGVRGLAILMVMAVHFVGDATARTAAERLVVKLASYGVLGVDLFFVLSGLLITGLLLDAKNSPHYFRNFYARRTLRIFPLYYLVLATLFIVLPRIGALSPALEEARERQVWLWTYTANFYIAAKSSWAALTYFSHFWSLAIEEHFYLLWPLVVFGFRREALERLCVFVIVGGAALRLALAAAGVSELSISVLTPCRVDALCVGALLAVLSRRADGGQSLVRDSGRAALYLGGLIVAISTWCALMKTGLPLLHQIRSSLYSLFFGALSLLSLRSPRHLVARVFQGRLLRFFGKYSYGLYVYHGLLTWYFLERRMGDRIGAALGHHSLAIAVTAAFGIGASLVIAVLSYEMFEKRFLQLKRFFEAGHELAAPAAAPRIAGAPEP